MKLFQLKLCVVTIVALFSAVASAVDSAVGSADQLSLEKLKQALEKNNKTYQDKLLQLEKRLEQAEQSTEETTENMEQLSVEVSQKDRQKTANKFNPAIGMILNGRWVNAPDDFEFSLPGFAIPEEVGPGDQGLQLGESELNMNANVDDKFYASTTIAFGEGAEVEEAFLQTLSLSHGFNLKFGQFFSSVGYLNSKHAHTDDFSSRPLPNEVFLGGNYGDAGIQATWVASTALFWESGVEVFRGDSFPAAGAAHSGAGAWTFFTHIGGDFSASQNWRAGLSYLNADVEGRALEGGEQLSETALYGDSALWIADFIYKWAPEGQGGYRGFKLQGEYFIRDEKGVLTDTSLVNVSLDSQQSGWYVEGVYRFSQQWRVGLRTAQVSADQLNAEFNDSLLDSKGRSPRQTSLMIDWSNSEFSRIRLQYDSNELYRSEDLTHSTEGVWTLQYIAAFGAHGAHAY